MSFCCPRYAVQALVAAEWTESRIATACGTSQSTINRVKHGRQRSVSFELGSALIRLAESQPDRRGMRGAANTTGPGPCLACEAGNARRPVPPLLQGKPDFLS